MLEWAIATKEFTIAKEAITAIIKELAVTVITKELGITVTIKEPSITIANLTNLLLKLVS